MSVIKEFKEFAVKGNVVDMAVGIIIGAAFGKIVSSFVADVVMPPIGVLLGGVDFSQLKIPLKRAADGSVTAAMNYGMFIQTVVDFLIIAFCVFMLVKAINTLRQRLSASEKEALPAAPTAEVELLSEIRDILKSGK